MTAGLALGFGFAALLVGATSAQTAVETECGGVGLEAREALAAEDWSLRVEAAQPDGSYLGDFSARILQDGAVVVEAACDGPWLLARLPAGRYEVVATHRGETRSRAVELGETGQAVATFIF